ncbi:MAG: hypothetical protein R2877_08340, partial [Bdellovibrionota bacterium]
MKLNKTIWMVLLAAVAATGCNKHKIADKAEEKPGPDINAATGETPDPEKALTGPLAIGVGEKYNQLMAAYNAEASKSTLKLAASYVPAAKKLTVSKDHSSLRIVSANAEGNAEAPNLKEVTKAPELTIGSSSLEVQVDEEKKQYSFKADTTTEVDLTKPITVALKGEDEKLKIEETKYELSPIVLLGKPEDQTQELVLDLSKGEVP